MPNLTASANPTTIPTTGGKSTITASGGVPPLHAQTIPPTPAGVQLHGPMNNEWEVEAPSGLDEGDLIKVMVYDSDGPPPNQVIVTIEIVAP